MAPSKQKAEKADVPADKLAALDYYTHNQEHIGVAWLHSFCRAPVTQQ